MHSKSISNNDDSITWQVVLLDVGEILIVAAINVLRYPKIKPIMYDASIFQLRALGNVMQRFPS